MSYRISGATHRNTHFPDKPNEDFFRFDESAGAAMLLDGVSRDRIDGVYPNPSPSREANIAFSVAAFPIMRDADGDPAATLLRAAEAGSAAVRELNHDANKFFLPGTVGVLALIRNSKLYYVYIGDSNGTVLKKAGLLYFTEPQTEAVHEHRKEFTARQIRSEICNNPAHPYGYGVWNGMESAKAFLRQGELPLDPGDRVLLFTDGFDELFQNLSGEEIYAMPTEKMLDRARDYVQEGKPWMDDRTIIVIE